MQRTLHTVPGAMNRRTALGTIAALAFARPGVAASFPAKPVTLVVPYSPGGGTDIVGRQLGQKLSERWSQPVIVDNRAGANGVIGSNHVAKSPPDGYTLLPVVGSHAVNPALMKRMPYDTLTAFSPITNVATSPMVLVVSAKGPYKTLPDLLKAARTQELGVGYSEGQTRLTGELMRQADLQTVGVAYKPQLRDQGAQLVLDALRTSTASCAAKPRNGPP